MWSISNFFTDMFQRNSARNLKRVTCGTSVFKYTTKLAVEINLFWNETWQNWTNVIRQGMNWTDLCRMTKITANMKLPLTTPSTTPTPIMNSTPPAFNKKNYIIMITTTWEIKLRSQLITEGIHILASYMCKIGWLEWLWTVKTQTQSPITKE